MYSEECFDGATSAVRFSISWNSVAAHMVSCAFITVIDDIFDFGFLVFLRFFVLLLGVHVESHLDWAESVSWSVHVLGVLSICARSFSLRFFKAWLEELVDPVFAG